MVRMGAREFVYPNFGYRSRWLRNRDPVYLRLLETPLETNSGYATEFASSYDLHLHGEKNVPEQTFFKYNNPWTVYFSALLLCMQKNRRKFYNNSATQNGASACVYFQRQRRWFSARDVRVTMQITSQFQYFA